MNRALLHAAVFGIGAAVGAGVASTICEKKRPVPTPSPPLVPETAKSGAAVTLPGARELQATADVLKHGNPGEWTCAAYAKWLRQVTVARHLLSTSLILGIPLRAVHPKRVKRTSFADGKKGLSRYHGFPPEC